MRKFSEEMGFNGDIMGIFSFLAKLVLLTMLTVWFVAIFLIYIYIYTYVFRDGDGPKPISRYY